ncbi:MAG: 4-(cytidine 5'-diphospho)-2-C-methyl-D-erythritol kinase [Candidatus Hydrogenedens sp.]|jgi:4-diphosphocytidyl-2-C-methyl-D-erythritol kinase|nr:4-(cytidine 5'-diphospho)-2-C-methyl-D-erythritol kinase [Candidatus Hydrogenedens sp.]
MAQQWRSYAKINLYLDVLRKRHDGYHAIETLFQSVSLYDELTISAEKTDLVLTATQPGLDCGPSNLVWKAARRLQEMSGCRLGARIHLEKNIPLAAGLAGGSGNAAATLAALNELWDLKLSQAQLLACARPLGADVSFCLVGGSRAATQKGDVLYPLPPLPPVCFVLVHPAISLSAGFIYTHPALKLSAARPVAGRSSPFRKALRALKSEDWSSLVYNAMEVPAFEEHPRLALLKNELLTGGCIAAAMSGSGPTLFGICLSLEEAERVRDSLKSLEPGESVSIVRPCLRGVEKMNP